MLLIYYFIFSLSCFFYFLFLVCLLITLFRLFFFIIAFFISYFAWNFIISNIVDIMNFMFYIHIISSPAAQHFIKSQYSLFTDDKMALHNLISNWIQNENFYFYSVLQKLDYISLFFLFIVTLLAFVKLLNVFYNCSIWNFFDLIPHLSHINLSLMRNQKSIDILNNFFFQPLINLEYLHISDNINDYLLLLKIDFTNVSSDELFFIFFYYYVITKNL